MLGDRIALSPSCPLPPVTNCTAIPRADDSPCGPPSSLLWRSRGELGSLGTTTRPLAPGVTWREGRVWPWCRAP